MAKIMVVSFKEEEKAIEALAKLNELESLGKADIYDKIMIRKNENGEYEVLQKDNAEGWRILTGMAIGGLLGAVAGPLGIIIGLYTGIIAGSITELNHYEFANGIMRGIETGMAVGVISVIAEIGERSDVIIEALLKQFDGVVSKNKFDFEYDSFLNGQIESLEKDMNDAGLQLQNATPGNKQKIERSLHHLKEQRDNKIAEFERRMKRQQKMLL